MKTFIRIALLSALIWLPGLSALAQNNALVGAGSTLAYPLLTKIFDDYSRTSKETVSYQAIGSGAGITLLSQKTIDFAAVDLNLTDDHIKKLGPQIVYVPIATGTIAIAYNVPGVKYILKLNATVLTGIYLGKITRWNDARIAKLNPGVVLPAIPILVVHRSDDSGSTSIFIKYFKDDANWVKSMGSNTPAKWPVGTGVKSNQGIAGLIKLTPGAIGYVALPYAIQYKIPFAALQIKAGSYVVAGNGNYPLTGSTGIIVYKQQNYSNRSLDRAKQLVKLLRYAVRDGQKTAESLNYEPLSTVNVNEAEKAIRSIIYDGRNL
ncbi:MAG: phosphate ABC transporter substrate-binding protein PstS [Mucilaginibacter sp.]